MSIIFSAEITGDVATQRRIERMDEALQVNPEGEALTRGLDYWAEVTKGVASGLTHRWTATLFQSYDVEGGDVRAFRSIFVDPTVVNPEGQYPAEYAAYEFARGGSHDAFHLAARHSDRVFAPRAAEMMAEDAVRIGEGG